VAVPTTMDPGTWSVKHLEIDGDGGLPPEMIKTLEIASEDPAEALAAARAMFDFELIQQ